MRRYRVDAGGRTHVIDVEEITETLFRVVVGGEETQVTLSAAEDVPEAVIAPGMGDVNGEDLPNAAQFRPPAPDTLRSMVPSAPPAKSAPALTASRGAVTAPMPGTITAVEVRPGDRVTPGQVLLKLEAMKMVNAIKSPRDGVIAAVAVEAGKSVTFGQVLVTFEEQ